MLVPLGGDSGAGGELSEGLGVPLTAVLCLCWQPEHPLLVREVRSSLVRQWLRKLVGRVGSGVRVGT